MYHSVTFGEKNTWEDWHLVPTSRPVFDPPAQKVKTLNIPGGDGLLDLSEALTGYPIYENRTGSFEFLVPNGFEPWPTTVIERMTWHSIYSSIMDYLHGQTMRAVLEDDPEYFYEGRFSVNKWKSNEDWSRIVIDYNVGPYKWSVLSSIDDWYWDPFSFIDGVIRSSIFRNISVTTSRISRKIDAAFFGRAPVCPVFVVRTNTGRGVVVRFVNPYLDLDMTTSIPDGRTQVPEFVFFGNTGATIYLQTVSGTGTVSIDFRQGRL